MGRKGEERREGLWTPAPRSRSWLGDYRDVTKGSSKWADQWATLGGAGQGLGAE